MPFSDWDRVKSPGSDQIVAYDTLNEPKDNSVLNKLAVLKVNGGLGTSMGMLSSDGVPLYFHCRSRHDWRQVRARG